MRVVLLTHYYEPEVGAPQRRWSAFVPRLVAAGHEVTVVTTVPHYPVGRAGPGAPPPGTARGRHGETVVRVPYVPYDHGRGRRLLDQLRVAAASVGPAVRTAPDVVLATAPGLPTMLAGRAVARRTGARQVLEMRDAWPDLLVDAGGIPAPVRAVVTWLLTRLQRQADTVVCVSERFAERLRGRRVHHVVHVANGTSTATLDPLPPVAPPAPGEPLRVLYAGTVGESQAVHLAVRAVGLAAPGTVALTVVGHGADLPLVHEERARLPRPDDVTVLPPTDPAGVRALLATHHTALVTLRDWPSFRATVPSKVYELLAVGRHVSAAVHGEAADVVRAAGGGDVVPPEDPAALLRLWERLRAEPARLDVGEGPRRWVAANADDDVLARRYLDVLAEVVGRAPSDDAAEAPSGASAAGTARAARSVRGTVGHPSPPVPALAPRCPVPGPDEHSLAQVPGSTWVVLGASGFVGGAVARAACEAGAEVRRVRAPRLEAPVGSDVADLQRLAGPPAADLAEVLRGADVVVNAAGLATPGAPATPQLVGADALLPLVVARAAATAGVPRVVHLSSAAVLGDRDVLDAGDALDPRTPYARAKALGERALAAEHAAVRQAGTTVVVARATSVQGPDRATTRALARLARSPLASVAGPGEDPVPVTSATGLGRWVLDLATRPDPPAVHLQPWEGWTTGALLRELGGREPLHLPVPLARTLVSVGYLAARLLGGRGRAAVRRVELVWFGQRQV